MGLAAADPDEPPVGRQTPREIVLERPTASHPEPFGLLTTVRELSDGRVVIADPLSRVVAVLDRSLQRAERWGREGAGPGEYRQPDAVWPLPADSTLLVDLGNARLAVVAPNGTIVRSFSMLAGRFEPGSGRPPAAMVPGGTDAEGRIYFQARTPASDSAPLLRVDPASGRVDTLARLKQPDVTQRTSGTASSRDVRIRPIPLSPSDGWAVGGDGSVGIARAADYRVEWIGPAGRRSGRPLPVPRVRIGAAEKREWLERQQLVGGIGMAVEVVNGETSVRLNRGRGADRPRAEEYTWPSEKPPFDASGILVDKDGRLWVLRHQPAGAPPRYDVIGRDGAPESVVRLPGGRRLIGFGLESLYAVAVDADGQHTLERYAIPR